MLRYIQQALALAIPAAIVFSCFWPYRKRALSAMGLKTNLWRETGLVLFVMALFGVLAVTLWPSWTFWQEGNGVWANILLLVSRPSLTDGLNLVPFRVLADLWDNFQKGPAMAVRAMINLAGNLLMFVPLGLLPSLLWRGATWRRGAAIGLGTSVFIEAAQYFLMRSTDIDDVILNTLGALCGWWLYLLLRRACPRFTEKFLVSQPGPHDREPAPEKPV